MALTGTFLTLRQNDITGFVNIPTAVSNKNALVTNDEVDTNFALLYNDVKGRLSLAGGTLTGALSGTSITLSEDIAVNGGDVTTTATTASLFNTTATTLNIGNAATTVSIGAPTGTCTIRNGSLRGSQTTQQLFDTVATTINFGLVATTLTIGATTGTTTIRNALSVTGNITGNLIGNASTATTLQTARTISLAGDVTGSVSFNGSTDVAINATIAANSVALGTDTTGDYVAAGAVSGNGLTGSATGEGSTFTVTSNAVSANTANTLVFRDASGNFSAGTITASLSGNASTATTLQTARNISLSGDVTGTVSFNGSTDVTITTTIAANSVALGTDTTGNYVAVGAVSGNGLSGSASAEGATFTVTSNAVSANTANTLVFRDASGNFSAGTITAALNGTASNVSSISSAVGNPYTWTALQNFLSGSGVGSAGQSGTLSAYGNAGGTNAAVMNFHRPGAYAINMGLDTDNVFRLGGWSDGANTYRFESNSSGVFIVRGDVRAPLFYDLNDTSYYFDGASISMANDFRANVFYDRLDPAYYMQPRSLSRFNIVMPNYLRRPDHNLGHLEGSYNNIGENSTRSNPIYTIGSAYNPNVNDLGVMYGIGYTNAAASFINFTGESGWGMYVASAGVARVWLDSEAGNVSCVGGVYGQLFYDYENTAFYIDPASTGTSGNFAGTVNAVNFNSTSDVTRKKNIETAKGMEVVNQLRGVEFDWTNEEQGHSSGVIAQEVEKVIPHVVGCSDGAKNVNYSAIIAYLIEGMKEQQVQINTLKEQVKNLIKE